MKMIIVIVKDSEADALTRALTEAEYRITRIASTGGFLRHGVATLLVGVEDEQVDSAIQLVRKTVTAAGDSAEKRATLFVVPVARFEQV
ncbi:MAG TPA: cyclic-di-AMP receptor [Anaerolineales bacterium]|nr:cyclic-di-AMP receptor [Anaerolineales bacterium]